MRVLSKYIRKLFLCAMIAALLLPVKVLAAGYDPVGDGAVIPPIDTGETGSLTINFQYEEQPAEGVNFRLYRVAEVSKDCKFTLTGDFAECKTDLQEPDAETWRQLVNLLPGYISEDTEPAGAVATDGTGKVSFANLQVGLYMVLGETYHADRKYVTPTSFLVSVPGYGANGPWEYDMNVACKYTAVSDTEDVDVEVIKVWNDENYSGRPTEITVELYDEAALYDTVVLNKDNNWSHVWQGLYGGTTWNVKEKEVPEGYTVSIDRRDTTRVITNTRKAPVPTPTPVPKPTPTPGPNLTPTPGPNSTPTPEPNSTPTPGPGQNVTPTPKPSPAPIPSDNPDGDDDGTGVSDENSTPGDSTPSPTPSPAGKLPQTGVLWWPVPVLAAAGLLLILLGLLLRRGDDHEE